MGNFARMQRRAFLRRGLGASLAGLGIGVVGGGLGGSQHAMARSARRHEPAHYGSTGRGAAQVVWSVDTDEQVVAATFDDGPHPRLTPRVLDLLAEHQARATFFLVGSAAERHPSLVRRILDEGHEVGNHSWSHAPMAHIGGDAARDEVVRGAAALASVTGEQVRWFRSPRGMLNGPILRAATDVRQDVAMWSARAPKASPAPSRRQITDHLLGALQPGTIYCLHDGTSGRDPDERLEQRRENELSALPEFLSGAIERGFRFLTISELVEHSRSASR